MWGFGQNCQKGVNPHDPFSAQNKTGIPLKQA